MRTCNGEQVSEFRNAALILVTPARRAGDAKPERHTWPEAAISRAAAPECHEEVLALPHGEPAQCEEGPHDPSLVRHELAYPRDEPRNFLAEISRGVDVLGKP